MEDQPAVVTIPGEHESVISMGMPKQLNVL